MIGNILAGVAIATFPVLPMQCDGGDSPPSAGPPIICDATRCSPENVTFGIWGAEGYVSGGMLCIDINNIGPGWPIETHAYYFGGGGSSYYPGWYFTIECPWHHPWIAPGTAYVYTWD